ncbi:MAG: glycoside hydrolase domain-containing protein [Candidatus Omnitrophota bacterium]
MLGRDFIDRVKTIVFSMLKGRYEDLTSDVLEEEPYIEFVKLEAPKTAKQGEFFLMNAYFKPQRRIDRNYKLFVHLYTGIGKGWINADRFPLPASSEWKPGEITKIGPMQIFVDEDAPLGMYSIEMGLFYEKKKSDGSEGYARLPYTNKNAHSVGTIKVLKGKKVSIEDKMKEIYALAMQKQGDRDYYVSVEKPINKIFREITNFSSDMQSEVSIQAARNEYESFQLVLMPVKADLKNVSVMNLPLRQINGNGIIGAENLHVNPVGYVKTENVADYPVEHVGWWPDPLLDSKAVNVAVGEVQPLWFTLYIPEDTQPGDYEGSIELKPEGAQPTKIALKLKVYNFTLPTRPHLKTAFDLYDIYIKKFYSSKNEYNRQMERVYYDDMLRHHISPIYIYGELPQQVDNTGSLYLNFDEYDESMMFCLEKGLSAFSIVREWGGENDNKWGQDEEVRGVLLSYADYLKMRKLFDMAYIYVFDEPGQENAEKIRHITKLIHSVHPDLKTLVTVGPGELWGDDIDIWCPQLINFREDVAEKERLKGKDVWWYVSGLRTGTPAFNIDQPAIDHRILFWMNWKYKVTGVLYWCINYWQKNPWETAQTWPNQNGNGCLLYPGDRGPVDTIRIEAIRDGIEDYEYMYILNDLTQQLKAQDPDNALIKEAERLLAVDESIVKTVYDYTKDGELLLKERERIAEMIEGMDSRLRGNDNKVAEP